MGTESLLARALEATCGGAIVLDEALRIVGATNAAARLLGVSIQPGAHAVKLLCGEAPDTSLAEALAAGRPVVASVSRLAESERLLRVRATPLRSRGEVVGWLLLLSEEPLAPTDAAEQLQGMWTRDPQMKKLFRLAEKVAHTEVNVLIEGEMGTGKASLAAAIHALSPRRTAPFRSINCLGAPPELVLEHLGDGGTLFFDDIADLSADSQAELLRVLEGIALPIDGMKRPVLDARIIAATRSTATHEVERGRLRADLMYRLRIVSLHLPPLRARRGDIALLADKFIDELNARGGRHIERIAPPTLERLESHAWPGNVRELRVAIESAFATGEGSLLALTDLPPEIAEPYAPSEAVVVSAPPPPPSDVDEGTRIRRALERAGGDRTRAATMLGMSRTTLWRRMRALGLLVALLVVVFGCGSPTRFAARPPMLHDDDDRPFSPAPAKDDESDTANTLDSMALGPLSHGFAFETSGEAHDVTSIDEVPDSSWFTNRTPPPEALVRGPCPDAGAVPPFTIKSSKTGGTTPGFVVKDARHQTYLLKVDELPFQPLSTAADAIVSRLYWAVGFNAPCNDVVDVDARDLLLLPTSYETLPTGENIPLGAARLAQVLTSGTRTKNGAIRFSTSRFIDGVPIGNWRTEGTRKDDPNDRIPHQDRRELRGEYFLAAWLAHWDSRNLNTFDTYVNQHVVHYFLDFSEALGGMPMRTKYPETRTGYVSVSNVPVMFEDLFTFGFARRPWDEVRTDPSYENLNYLDVGHFDPMAFSPQTPLLRWARADKTDLAWMARKIARLESEHVRVAVRAGRLSDPAEEARLLEILAGRRERLLRASFQQVSPLADVGIEGSKLCATDLGITTKLSNPESVLIAPRAERTGARICVPLPRTSSYTTVDLVRKDSGRTTVLRAHLYPPDRERGWLLAGLERL